jgi:callose synthase
LEEAYKMRNVLQEFVRRPKDQAPTILGLREHIFTGRFEFFPIYVFHTCNFILINIILLFGSVSSLAGFMSYQETSFVTIGQRFLADPLR